MQIFFNKKWISESIYEPLRDESIIIPDTSEEALKIKNGYNFDIVNGNIIIKNKIKDTEKEKKDKLIDSLKTIDDIKNYLKTI